MTDIGDSRIDRSSSNADWGVTQPVQVTFRRVMDDACAGLS
jgi:hypothetical protein